MIKYLVLIIKFMDFLTNQLVQWIQNIYYNNYLLYFKASLADKVVFRGSCILQIKKGAQIQIGRKFRVNSGQRIGSDTLSASKITVMNGAKLIIGNNSGIANTVLWCRCHIELGDYVKIGTGCFIMDNNFHCTDWRIRMTSDDSRYIACAPVVIKSHAFIGARCTICKGVTIGEHSMVAAGSVVVNNIPDNELWGGNPARFIKRIE